MAAIRARALSYVADQKVDLPAKICREVRDWHIVDSTTVQLADELKGEYPGTGDYAALKVHKRYSVGIGNGRVPSQSGKGARLVAPAHRRELARVGAFM